MQVSVGTLLAFTMVAISVLILRYIPPDEVPLPPSLEESIGSASLQDCWISNEITQNHAEANIGTSTDTQPLVIKEDLSVDDPLIPQHLAIGNCKSCLLLLTTVIILQSTTLQNFCL